jgi:hypothetical protein
MTPAPDMDSAARQRLILLLGSPRSGTTWLAKILDSYENVLYLHEPFRKIRDAKPGTALRRVANGEPIDPLEREAVLCELARLQTRCVRPPFFPKRFRICPTPVLQLAWLASEMKGPGRFLFRRLYDVPLSTRFELLLKEVDWHPGFPAVDGLNPQQLVLSVRHPCAVVCSRLTGIRMGVVPDHNREAWLNLNLVRAKAAGYTASDVQRMSPCEFYALNWLVENQEYQSIAARHPHSATVVFEELCRDPLRITTELFQSLGWTLGSQTERFINRSGSSSWRTALARRASARRWYYGIYRDSDAEPNKWRNLLSASEVQEILNIVRPFALTDWER